MQTLCQDRAPSTQRGERWFPDSSGASLAKFTHAAEALATQAAGLFSKSDTGENALSGTKPDVEASPAAPDEPPVQCEAVPPAPWHRSCSRLRHVLQLVCE